MKRWNRINPKYNKLDQLLLSEWWYYRDYNYSNVANNWNTITPLKFGSPVFWVSTEMQNWCRLLQNIGRSAPKNASWNFQLLTPLKFGSLGCARFAEIWLKYFEFHILWSLSSVDFHTLTLQLPIQTPNSVAPELQAFVSSLAILAKRASFWVLLTCQMNHISENGCFSAALYRWTISGRHTTTSSTMGGPCDPCTFTALKRNAFLKRPTNSKIPLKIKRASKIEKKVYLMNQHESQTLGNGIIS